MILLLRNPKLFFLVSALSTGIRSSREMASSLFSTPAFPEIALPFLTSSISSALGKMASCLAALPVSPLGACPGVGAHAGNGVGHTNPTQAPNAGRSPPFTTDSL